MKRLVQDFLGHKDVKTSMVYTGALNRGPRPELAAPSICTQVGMEGPVPIHMRYGDKNSFLLQQLAGV